jgi:hypothetical protein
MRKTFLTPITVKGFQLVFGEDQPPLGSVQMPTWAEQEVMTELLLSDSIEREDPS